MSFQAYLDKVEERTGKTPKQIIAMAKRGSSPNTRTSWLG